jgi:hypothetical protein
MNCRLKKITVEKFRLYKSRADRIGIVHHYNGAMAFVLWPNRKTLEHWHIDDLEFLPNDGNDNNTGLGTK